MKNFWSKKKKETITSKLKNKAEQKNLIQQCEEMKNSVQYQDRTNEVFSIKIFLEAIWCMKAS